MTVDIYRTISNSHMAEGIFAHVPQDRLLIQGDFYDASWEIYWWQDTYMDNVRHRNLQVDRDVPVHGRVLPLPEVLDGIRRQTKAAQVGETSTEVMSSATSMPSDATIAPRRLPNPPSTTIASRREMRS